MKRQHTTVILDVVARACFYPGMVFAAYLLWGGHNAPGGGFIAGLIALAVLALQMMAFGLAWQRARLDALAPRLAGGGLALAALTGAGSLVFQFPFLTSAVSPAGYTTAFFFDLGVCGVVVGSGLLILRLIGEPHDA